MVAYSSTPLSDSHWTVSRVDFSWLDCFPDFSKDFRIKSKKTTNTVQVFSYFFLVLLIVLITKTVKTWFWNAFYFALLFRMIPSYFCWNHFMASSLVRRWMKPILPVFRRLWATLYPGKEGERKRGSDDENFVWIEPCRLPSGHEVSCTISG